MHIFCLSLINNKLSNNKEFEFETNTLSKKQLIVSKVYVHAHPFL